MHRLARDAGTGDVAPLFLILHSRHLAWTGRLDLAAGSWDAAVRAAAATRARQAEDPLRGPALAEAALAAQAIGAPALSEVAPIEAAADDVIGECAGGMLERTGWSEFRGGRPDDGLRRWLAHANGSPAADVASAAALGAAFVCGLLGTRPDATRNRLRFAPALPADWERLAAARVSVADAKVGLEYRREANRHVFRIEQTEGAVPLRVIFEPSLAAAGLAHAEVDGREASLDAHRAGARLVVPAQLVLDHARSVGLTAC